MTTQIIGPTFGSNTSDLSGGYLCMSKFTASTGTLSEIKVHSIGSGNVKVGIYSDSSGSPNALLASSGSTAVTSGTNTIAISPTSLSGADYWLAINQETNNLIADANSGSVSFKALTYSNSFPDPAGTGFSTGAHNLDLQGWGTQLTFQLVGPTFGAHLSTLSTGYICMSKYTASATGAVSEIKLYAVAAGNVKVGVYSDLAGVPDTLLTSSASTLMSIGTHSVAVSPAATLTNGASYWLAVNSDTNNVTSADNAGTFIYKGLTYSSTFPNPAGTGFATLSKNIDLQAWGALVTSSVKTIGGLAIANVKTVDGVPIELVKTMDGLS